MTNFTEVFAEVFQSLKVQKMGKLKDHEKMHLAEYIHAWADGAGVEYFDGLFTSAGERWKQVEFSHNWAMPSACKYRFKPKTIKIGNIEVPEPMHFAPAINSFFWAPELVEGMPTVFTSYWSGGPNDFERLRNGFCHTSKEAALAHAKALVEVTKQALG